MIRSRPQQWTVWGIHIVSPKEEKEGCGGRDLQKREVLSLEWKSEGLMDY